jgi:hypothetical protein
VRNNTIKNKFLNLPLPQKLIGGGALLALIGSLLPWYHDFDAFNHGVQFLGVTGPLYLVGFIIISLSIFSLILTGFYLLEKNLPDLPMKESLVYILSGATGLFLLLIANSVYFHKDFGTNITSKEYGIGMMIVLVGAIAVTLGGILQSRESGTARFINKFKEETGLFEEEEEKIDPVVELNNFQREQQAREIKQKETLVAEEPVIEPKKSLAQERFEGHSGVREYKAKSDIAATKTKVRQEPYPDPSLLKKEAVASRPAAKDEENSPINPNSVIRMDL